MKRGISAALVITLAGTMSCARFIPRLTAAAAPTLPEAKARVPRRPPPPEWYWEHVDADVRTPSRKPLELPVIDERAVTRVEGAARIWDELPPVARERVRKDGFLVIGPDAATEASPAYQKRTRSIGAFYTDLREQRVPHIVTLDALFAIVHLGIERALAHVEDELATALQVFLDKLDARLAAEETGAGTELAEPYRIARGIVAVARSLSSASPITLPPDLAKLVIEEHANIQGHAGVATSPVLGLPLDYARFTVPSAAARPGSFRALAWLGAAPMMLAARSEAPGASVNVAQVRANTRAAMLLARAADRDIDAAQHAAYAKMTRLIGFVWGAPDDLSLVEIDTIADSAGIDLTKPANISNVARIDKVRARALTGRTPAAHDGAGGVGRAGLSVRLFGGHASVDSLVLQSLVGAPAGLAQESAASASIDRLRKGRRVLPSTLDIAAWLDPPEARTILRESHADAFDGYDAALAAVQRTRPLDHDSVLHASVHGSLIDALITWARMERSRASIPVDRARVESMLAAWTLARHVGQPLSRPKPSFALAKGADLRVSGGPLPVFVEPAPEVVARLAATVRQLRRGLETLAPLAPSSNATATLVEIEDILLGALKGAERHASDEALSTEEAAALASLPARLARIEDEANTDLGPVVAAVYSDPKSGRVLASATGKLEPVLMLVREANKDEPILVVGAHVAHHELVEGLEAAPGVLHGVRPALTDASWRARLKPGAPPAAVPPRAPWVASFRWTR